VVNEYCCYAQSCAALGEASLRSDEENRNFSGSRIGEVMGEGMEYEVVEVGEGDICSAGVEHSKEGG
jgi:hypothetical protein